MLENMGAAVGNLISSKLQAQIWDSSSLSDAIFHLRLPVCQRLEVNIRSARPDNCSSESPDTIKNGGSLFYLPFLSEFKALSNILEVLLFSALKFVAMPVSR
jgi:hypothetical protein